MFDKAGCQLQGHSVRFESLGPNVRSQCLGNNAMEALLCAIPLQPTLTGANEVLSSHGQMAVVRAKVEGWLKSEVTAFRNNIAEVAELHEWGIPGIEDIDVQLILTGP